MINTQKSPLSDEITFLVVGFIANDEELLADFLALSGLSLEDLKNRLQEPDFLGCVLDFLLEREETLTQFCEQHKIHPTDIWRARKTYPGMNIWDSV